MQLARRLGKLAEGAGVVQAVESEKTAPQPVTWVHSCQRGRTLYTTLGTSEDFKDENFQRLPGNAIFWTARGEPGEDAEVAPGSRANYSLFPNMVRGKLTSCPATVPRPRRNSAEPGQNDGCRPPAHGQALRADRRTARDRGTCRPLGKVLERRGLLPF